MARILFLLMFPFVCFSQITPNEDIPDNNLLKEKENLDTKRKASYNLEEIKVRWKKAALENCPGVPCPTFSAPGPCSSITATPTGPSSVRVSFGPPTNDGGSAITGYIATATSTPSAPAKRKSSSVITVNGTSSPILITGLTFGVNYIFSVVATNAVGGSPPVTTTTTVTPCILNTAATASSSPTLSVNTALTSSITIATTGATGIGTATNLPVGVTAVWLSNVITISGTPTASGTFNYVIPLTGGCGSVNATGTITVTSCTLNTAATASSSPTLLVNTALTPSITIATTGATGIGTATNLPVGVTAVWLSNVITISGTPTASGTFNYVIPLTGGCGSVNATGTITVTSAPFTCGTSTITSTILDIDGNPYNTVLIGSQCWTRENLKVSKYNDGTAIPFNNTYTSGTTSTEWQGLMTGAYTIYGNQASSGANATNYGFLYNWYAVADSRKLCPDGWNVPTASDWNKLVIYLHSGADTTSATITQSTIAGGYLKSNATNPSTSYGWTSPNTATNSSYFFALPGGNRQSTGSFNGISNNAYFWSATEKDPSSANYRYLFFLDGKMNSNSINKAFGHSVRCLKY